LFVHSSDELYGSDVVLLELIRRLDRSRFEPLVALPTDLSHYAGRARLSDQLAHIGVPVRHCDYAVLRRRYLSLRALPRFALLLWRGSRELAQWIRSEEVQLVHANTAAVWGGAAAARLAGRPLVWHVHEIIAEPRWLRWLTARVVTGTADRVVAISGPVAEHLLAFGAVQGARAKVVVIPDAVDTGRFRPDNDGSPLRESWGIAPDQVLIGVVGRIHTWKGQEILVEAARLLRDRCPQCRYVIAGDIVPGQPEPKQALEAAIAAANLAGWVQLVGFRPDPEQVMAALDILVLPSTSPEPFGLVLLEAMASGKPVIATAHGGPLEIVADGETGFLVSPRDTAALAAAIERLANDPDLRASMGAAGHTRAEAEFGFAAHVTAFEELYSAILTSR
jgi:glycosyltransferase involved in cell wall biosynthesis